MDHQQFLLLTVLQHCSGVTCQSGISVSPRRHHAGHDRSNHRPVTHHFVGSALFRQPPARVHMLSTRTSDVLAAGPFAGLPLFGG
jgi:hypothetical protein